MRVALSPAVPAHFHRQFTERFGIGLIDGYGSTETNCIMGTSLTEQRPGTMGRLLKGFSARVVDGYDNEVPDGEAGELMLRADEPFAFATGYFGMPEKTVEAWRNLWFHTGDRVVRESDGYYRFMDRMKDAIRRRGENISSYEVEQVIVSHPRSRMPPCFRSARSLPKMKSWPRWCCAPARSLTTRRCSIFVSRACLILPCRVSGIRRRLAGDRERQGDQVQTPRAWGYGRDLGPDKVGYKVTRATGIERPL